VDEDDRVYKILGTAQPLYHITIPLVVLVLVVALVSALVFGGVIQGHAERVGPERPATTQPTLLIEP